MDLSLSEEQEAIRDLAGTILREQLPPERIRAIEDEPAGSWFASDVWRALARADLLGLALPESAGGAGYGFIEVCLVLEQQGTTVAPLPLLPTLVLGALPIARFGSPEQQARFLPGVAAGDVVLTAALAEDGFGVTPGEPATTATRVDDGWRIDGEKALVPAADVAACILVPARTGDGTSGVFLVDPSSPDVELERNDLLQGEPRFTMRLNGAAVAAGDVLGDPYGGTEIVRWIDERAVAGLCAIQTGVCDEALRITGRYVSEREQFGSKIGTFQAVAQRLADAYIDTEGVRLTAIQAAWRLAEGLDAAEAVAIAKFWASEGGHRVVHACQHVHGGIGVDTDYPIHRYFRWAKVVEFTLGGATEHLRRLGSLLGDNTRLMALLEVAGVNVRFGGHHAVRDVDLDVEAGVVTGLIGPNGAGKTTMFNVITGLQEATSGRVSFDGRDITRLAPHRRARLGIARTFQRLEVFGSLTARENILAAAEIRRSWSHDHSDPGAVADQIIERIGIEAVANDRVDAMPTGLARLVELGRALATRPRAILLDEPASGLDEAESEAFGELLLELADEGMAVLMVEHDVALVMQVCARIHVLDFGAILAVGTPEEIRQDRSVLDAYLGTVT